MDCGTQPSAHCTGPTSGRGILTKVGLKNSELAWDSQKNFTETNIPAGWNSFVRFLIWGPGCQSIKYRWNQQYSCSCAVHTWAGKVHRLHRAPGSDNNVPSSKWRELAETTMGLSHTGKTTGLRGPHWSFEGPGMLGACFVQVTFSRLGGCILSYEPHQWVYNFIRGVIISSIPWDISCMAGLILLSTNRNLQFPPTYAHSSHLSVFLLLTLDLCILKDSQKCKSMTWWNFETSHTLEW